MKLKENVNFQLPLCRFLIYYYLENTKKAKIMQRDYIENVAHEAASK